LEEWSIELFFDTPWYCAQPCREPIDLAKSDGEILAWTEQLVRARPGFKPHEAWIDEVRTRMAQGS